MTFPATWTKVRVTCTYLKRDGTPNSGRVVFKSPQVIAAGGALVLPTTIIAKLDYSGQIDIEIPSTDDPDISAEGWTWRVSEVIERGRVFNLAVPYTATLIDLATVAPSVAPSPMTGMTPYSLSAGTIEALPAGSPPTMSITGAQPNQVLNVGLPAPAGGATINDTTASTTTTYSSTKINLVVGSAVAGLLSDAPADGSIYGRQDNAWVVVPTSGGGGSATWGTIGGTLANQTDLQTALNAKAATASLAAVATSGAYGDLSGRPTLGTAAATATTDYATAAQGTKADAALPAAQVGIANGVTPLGADAKIATTYLPTAVLGQVSYQGPWDASAGTPPTASPQKGWYYIVTVSGTTNLGGITDWALGDWAIYDGAAWGKVDNTDAVSMVAGLVGVISAASLIAALGLKTVATSGSYTDLTGKPTLGTAAATDSTAYATAAQGTKADAAWPASSLTGATKLAVVATLPGTPDANTLYFTTT